MCQCLSTTVSAGDERSRTDQTATTNLGESQYILWDSGEGFSKAMYGRAIARALDETSNVHLR